MKTEINLGQEALFMQELKNGRSFEIIQIFAPKFTKTNIHSVLIDGMLVYPNQISKKGCRTIVNMKDLYGNNIGGCSMYEHHKTNPVNMAIFEKPNHSITTHLN